MDDTVKSFVSIHELCLNNGMHNILEYDNEVTQQEERRLYIEHVPLSQEDVPQSTFCNESNCVLVIGYFRGGTTMTLDVLAQARSTFYAFEPINWLSVDSYNNNPTKFYNDSVRTVKESELPRVQAEMLINWFNCDVTKLNVGDLTSSNLVHHSKVTRTYYSCQKKKKNIKECIKILESACSSARNRILKVVRLRIEAVDYILRKFKNLKIVYIVRDPRGQINSLIQTKLLNADETDEKAKKTCNDMMQDIQATQWLKSTYVHNIFMLKYEALVESPVSVFKNVFNFSHLTFTEKVEKYINVHLMGSDKVGGNPWLIKSGNAKSIANNWRKSSELQHLRAIDAKCHDVYTAFGYKQLDVKYLRNQSITTCTKPAINSVFDIY